MSYRILLLSAYDAMSHKSWRNRLESMFPEHKWTQLSLPPRHFNWRIRGNSLQWALTERERLSRDYDLLIATSMVDLASLRGLLPALCSIPTLVYFHENQFVYPVGREQRSSNIEPQLVPIYSAYCADAVAFNSDYNRSTFLQGTQTLFDRLPDRLAPSLLEKLQDSEVLAVPLEELVTTSSATTTPALLDVVWNHRWEYDKGPELLLRLAEQLLAQRLAIRLHIVGQQFRSSPKEFERLDAVLAEQASVVGFERGQFGFIEDRAAYIALLRRCDVVLSTALHDFQGLAVQEACLLGCSPLVPKRLVYPEYIASQFLYAADGDEEASCEDMLARLRAWHELRRQDVPLPKQALEQFSQAVLRPQYAALFERLVETEKA